MGDNMKKVLFLQVEGNSCGGVWFVNKTIGEELIKHGYSVLIMSVRDSGGKKLEHNKKLNVSIVNSLDPWQITHFEDIKKELRKFHILSSFNLILKKIKEEIKLKKDFNYIRKYIIKENFDYIITSHYQLLDCIPKKYLKRTIHEQHTSFETSYSHAATRKTLDKYNGLVKYLWLSKSSSHLAKEKGYKNSTYIYNPVRFKSLNTSSLENKKLITIARISEEKRIDLMINIVNDLLKDPLLKEWSLDIYGDGPLKDKLMTINYDKNKIRWMGSVNLVSDVLLKASINLNTSLFEGFAMGILEANECGVPTISFRFGESIDEEIINNKTGIIVEQNDILSYKEKLKELMLDNDKLKELSNNSKEFSKNFQVENIIKDWLDLFKSLD